MATIKFKAKIEPVYDSDDQLAYELIRVPKLTKRHCKHNEQEFCCHKKFGSYYNSDLFPGFLNGIRLDIVGQYSDHVRLDKLPANVVVDRSSFLAAVTIKV